MIHRIREEIESAGGKAFLCDFLLPAAGDDDRGRESLASDELQDLSFSILGHSEVPDDRVESSAGQQAHSSRGPLRHLSFYG